MPAHFASYIIHHLLRHDLPDATIPRLHAIDQALTALQHEPRLWSLWLAESVQPLETYLRYRPAQYDAVANLCQQGRLGTGAFWVPPGTWQDSLELLIRNLHMGLDTLHVLRVPKPIVRATLSTDARSPLAQLPQILRGMGIDSLLDPTPNQPMREWVGADGTRLPVFSVGHGTDFAVAAVARHVAWETPDSLAGFDALRQHMPTHDHFISSPAGFLSAAEKHLSPMASLPVVQLDSATNMPILGAHPLVRKLVLEVEPAAAWGILQGNGLAHPQPILNQFWRQLLHGLSTDDDLSTLSRDFDDFLAHYSGWEWSSKMDAQHVQWMALKPHAEQGVIWRVYNPAQIAESITLTVPPTLSRCDVLRLDASRSGATLPITDGKIRVTVHPYRLLTLWLR